MSLVELAARANEASRASRRPGAPLLSEGSSRETLIEWLQWNDPNGCYSDEACAVEGYDPLHVSEGWHYVSDALDGA